MSKKRENGNSCTPWPDHPLFAGEDEGPYDAGPARKGMRTVSVRRPGQKGTLGALREYGDRLVCARYLKDDIRGKRYKTLEIIVHEEDWTPPAPTRPKAKPPGPAHGPAPAPGPGPGPGPGLGTGPDPERIVSIRLTTGGEALRAKVWTAGGRWDSAAKVWRIRYRAACALGLEGRIVQTRGEPR